MNDAGQRALEEEPLLKLAMVSGLIVETIAHIEAAGCVFTINTDGTLNVTKPSVDPRIHDRENHQ